MNQVNTKSPRVTYDPATELFSVWVSGDLVFRSDNLSEVADALDWVDFSEGT